MVTAVKATLASPDTPLSPALVSTSIDVNVRLAAFKAKEPRQP
jgi:hypothetical protein